MTTNAETMAKLVEAVASLKGQPHRQVIATITDKIVPKLATKVEASTGKIKKLFEEAHNSCASIADGLKSNDVSKQEFAEFVKELNTLHLRTVAVEEELARAPAKQTANRFGADSEEWLNNEADKARKVLQSYEQYKVKVPPSIPKKFMATRLPVIPLTNPVMRPEPLEKLKLLDNTFFGYPILKNQVVVGLNKDWISGEYKSDLDEAIEDMVTLLKQQTNKRFMVIGNARLRRQVYWVWLAEESAIQKFNRAAPGGHFQMKGWGFPFEADEIIKGQPAKAPV